MNMNRRRFLKIIAVVPAVIAFPELARGATFPYTPLQEWLPPNYLDNSPFDANIVSEDTSFNIDVCFKPNMPIEYIQLSYGCRYARSEWIE